MKPNSHHWAKDTPESPDHSNASRIQRSLVNRCQGGNVSQGPGIHARSPKPCDYSADDQGRHGWRSTAYRASDFKHHNVGKEEPFDIEDAIRLGPGQNGSAAE